MRSRRRLCAWALVACIAGAAVGPASPRAAWAQATSPANEAAARRHFERARAYYAQGSYRDAIGELEAAHSLDPNAKDLVFNLGIVHEKLGHIDDALKWSRLYATMDLTPAEREKAEAYVHRLEGAQKELEDKQAVPDAVAPVTAAPPVPAPAPPPPAAVERPSGGHVDVLAIGLGSVSAAALVFGVVLAVKAQVDVPPTPFVTGRDGTYAELVDRQANAHREAIMADIGFGVAATAAAATVILLVLRPRARPGGRSSISVSTVPLVGGGGVLVQGSF
jgi:tetratricopeptide (TPR) repeat protein